MAKRFTDTEIWNDQIWFVELDPFYKLAWKYVGDACDHAGIWKIDVLELKRKTKIPQFNVRDFVDACNRDFDKFSGEEVHKERLRIVQEKYLWITGFIQFQYGNKKGFVTPNNITRSAFDILESLSLLNESINKGFITLPKGYDTLAKGTERDKDKDKDNIKIKRYSESDIDQIYQAYPRDAKPLKARESINRALNYLAMEKNLDDPVAHLLKKTKVFAQSPAGNKGEYTPYPTTWYDEHRFLEDPDEWFKTKGKNGNEESSAYTPGSDIDWAALKKKQEEEAEHA